VADAGGALLEGAVRDAGGAEALLEPAGGAALLGGAEALLEPAGGAGDWTALDAGWLGAGEEAPPLGVITGIVAGGAAQSLVTVTYTVTGWHAAGALGEAGGAETGGMEAGGAEAGGADAGGADAGADGLDSQEAGGMEAGGDCLDSQVAGGDSLDSIVAGGGDACDSQVAGGDGIDFQVAGGFPSVSVTGQIVVETAMVFVTTAVILDSAGQSVTLAAHEVIVSTVVV
jgi:hypothetical protein